jgi:hypothetical protein
MINDVADVAPFSELSSIFSSLTSSLCGSKGCRSRNYRRLPREILIGLYDMDETKNVMYPSKVLK